MINVTAIAIKFISIVTNARLKVIILNVKYGCKIMAPKDNYLVIPKVVKARILAMVAYSN